MSTRENAATDRVPTTLAARPQVTAVIRRTPRQHIATLDDMERLLEMVRAIETADRVLDEDPTLSPGPPARTAGPDRSLDRATANTANHPTNPSPASNRQNLIKQPVR
jgi:hypothetical protein